MNLLQKHHLEIYLFFHEQIIKDLYHYLKKSAQSYEAVELSNKQRNYLIKKFKIKAYPTIESVKKKYYIVY